MRTHTSIIKSILAEYNYVFTGQDSSLDFSTIVIIDEKRKETGNGEYPLYDSILPICVLYASAGYQDLPEASLWIVINDSPHSIVSPLPEPCIVIDDAVAIDKLYHQLTEGIFQQHIVDSLYRDVLDEISKTTDLNAVLRIFTRYLNAPFTIMSPARRILASSFPKDNASLSRHPLTENMKATLERGYLVEESVDFIKERSGLEILKSQVPNKVLRIKGADDLDVLAVDLFVRDQFFGSLVMYGFYRKLTDLDIDIMDHLRKLIMILINSNPNISRQYSAAESYFVFDLITQKLNKVQALKLAEERGITTKGWLKAFLIKKKVKKSRKNLPLSMFFMNLGIILGSRFSVIIDDDIFIISELGESPVLSKSGQDKLIRYLEENELICAVSDPFTNISVTRQVWKQTKYLIDTCYPSASENTVLLFSDYIGQWILDEFQNLFSEKTIYHTGFLLLQQYDNKNETEYMKTLKAYIKCDCNLTKCATALNIHYNTAKYRLNMIKSIGGLKLDTPTEINNVVTYLRLQSL